MKLKSVKKGVRVELKESVGYNLPVGTQGTIHFDKLTLGGEVGVVFDNYNSGHNFKGVFHDSIRIDPMPDRSGLWVEPENLRKVK